MVGDKVEEVKWKGQGVNDHWQQMKDIMMETAQDIMWNDKRTTQTQGCRGQTRQDISYK